MPHRSPSCNLISIARSSILLASLASIGCNGDWGGERKTLGALTVVVQNEGSLSLQTWNASSTCTLDADAGTSMRCDFPFEDDEAEVSLVPLALTGTVDYAVSACGKPIGDDAFELRDDALVLRPREVLLGADCSEYPVRIEATFHAAPPDDAGPDDSAVVSDPDAARDTTSPASADDAVGTE